MIGLLARDIADTPLMLQLAPYAPAVEPGNAADHCQLSKGCQAKYGRCT